MLDGSAPGDGDAVKPVCGSRAPRPNLGWSPGPVDHDPR